MENAAQVFVSIKFVNDMVLLQRATGSLEAKRQCPPHPDLATPARLRLDKVGIH